MFRSITASMLASFIFYSASGYALEITTTKFTDTFDGTCDSDCSLREAVHLANSSPGIDHIYLKPGTYILDIPVGKDWWEFRDEDDNENGDLDILEDVVIHGSTTADTIIDAANDDRAIENKLGNSIFENITLKNGRVTASGGGIENHAGLTLRYCKVASNTARVAGGGIANYGLLNIHTSKIRDNAVHGGHDVRPAEGGGIYNTGILNIRDTSIENNLAFSNRDINMGGGLFNNGVADIRRSLFFQNSLHKDNNRAYQGNGLAILNSANGMLRLVSTTVSGQKSSSLNTGYGAAVAHGDPLYAAPGRLTMSNVTVADNLGLGILIAGDAYMNRSIVLGNLMTNQTTPSDYKAISILNNPPALNTYMTYLGHARDFAIFDPATAFTVFMMPLADNGGPTLTHAPRAGSPLLDVWSIWGLPCPASDQRGFSAPQDGDNDGIKECDIGAVEYQPSDN